MTNDRQAYITLWRAKIIQMLTDATSLTIAGEAPSRWLAIRSRGQRWFTDAGAEFYATCASADLDPSQVRAYALSAIQAFNAKVADGTAGLDERRGRNRLPTPQQAA
ncbi:hypothetical protein [Methylobacterium sp. 88A]|uniref:hypothetical protein n=1 Tax=Methylobacterium sp. 88A TaxID=1131813 RepID=UPI00037D175B|nr:hypothetical protein [Methylobacterium sp. 88A]